MNAIEGECLLLRLLSGLFAPSVSAVVRHDKKARVNI